MGRGGVCNYYGRWVEVIYVAMMLCVRLFEKVIQTIVQRHIDEKNLLNTSQFGFHSTTLQCMRLMGHVTLNFNNNRSTVVVFLDI